MDSHVVMKLFLLLNCLLHASKYMGSYVSMVLVHGIDSGEHSSEPYYRMFCHRKYIKVAWHHA